MLTRRSLFTGDFLRPAETGQTGPTAEELSKARVEVEALFTQGLAAFSSDDYPAALTPLREALKRDPKRTRARLMLGIALYRLKRDINARVELERLMRENAELVPAALHLACIFLRAGRQTKAKDVLTPFLDQASRHIRDDVEARFSVLAKTPFDETANATLLALLDAAATAATPTIQPVS